MQVEIRSLQLHNPLFCGGKNLGQKLDTSATTGLKIHYNTARRLFVVTWNGKCKVVTESNAADFDPMNPTELDIILLDPHVKPKRVVQTAGPAPLVTGIQSAQVSTPHGLDRSKL
jgi:hypothetical protein